MIRCYVTITGLNDQAPPRLRKMIERHATHSPNKPVLPRRVRVSRLVRFCEPTVDLGSQYGGHWDAKYFTYKRKGV